MHNTQSGIKILSGVAGIKSAYLETLTSKNLDIVCLSDNYAAVLGDWFDRVYGPKLFAGVINTREILPDNAANKSDSGNKDGKINQVRFIKPTESSQSDMILADNSAVLISFNPDSPTAIVISDMEIVNSLKTQFAALWQSLK